MSIGMIFMFCIMVAASWISVMPYVPRSRQIPRHSSMYIAMMQTFDRPSMVPIKY